MKISIVTVVYNGQTYLRDCIESVLAQTYKNIEYIFIDGNSTDNTLLIAKEYKDSIQILLSEPDLGMYNALNKGIELATGDVVGILNADDLFAHPNVIKEIAAYFLAQQPDAVYGNLNYVNAQQPNRVIRKWKSSNYTLTNLAYGWMPAHPTLYLKKELFKKFGNYSLAYGSAADYELMLRFLYHNKINAHFINTLMVNMRVGGMSNGTFKQRISALINDFKALKTNQIPYPLLALIFKKIRKIKQYF